MKRALWPLLALLAALAACRQTSAPPELLDHGRFEKLHLLRPDGPAQSTVLLFSSAAGWDQNTEAYAQKLRAQQALVAVIDSKILQSTLSRSNDDCAYLVGDLDNLSHFVQAYSQQSDYRPPLLFGVDEGAALVFGILAQASDHTLAGGVGVGFKPSSTMHPPLCKGNALEQHLDETSTSPTATYLPTTRLPAPFVAVAPEQHQDTAARDFLAQVPGSRLQVPKVRWLLRPNVMKSALRAYKELAATINPTQTANESLPDLPLNEVPAASRSEDAGLFAVLLSGDGGWAGLDEGLAAALAAHGIPIVGLDSLRYFWTARTPDGIATDLQRVIEHYSAVWQRPRVLLLGYSQGADVLPFALNRLNETARKQVVLTGAIALSTHAAFEFHVGAWAGEQGSHSTLPEISRLIDDQRRFVIICGTEDEDAVCPQLDAQHYDMVLLPGGHHFDGEYERLAQTLIAKLPAAEAAAAQTN